MRGLSGKTAIISGSSRGIGKAIALRLAREGVAVFITAEQVSDESQAVIPAMKAQGGGRIIHVASQHGIVANEGRALYGMTKAALAYLARAMAYELSPFNILVNAVSPGPIASEAYQQRAAADPEFARRRLSYIPLGRVGEPDEVAATVAFLASDEATFIQGHNLVVDGGYIIH